MSTTKKIAAASHLRVAHSQRTTSVTDAGKDAATHNDLNEVIERVRKKLATANRDDAFARYEVGVEISEAKGMVGKYGKRAVETIAAALKVSPKTLYNYGTTSEAWRRPEFEALMARTTPAGLHLSWSHLFVLAAVEPKDRRAELATQVLADSLTVRDLKKMTRVTIASTPDGEARPEPISLLEGMAMIRTAAQDVVSQMESWLDEALPALEATEAPAEDLLERIENAKDDLEDTSDDLRDRLAQLGKALKTARSKVDANGSILDLPAPASTDA